MKSRFTFILLIAFVVSKPQKSFCKSTTTNCINNLQSEIKSYWEHFTDNRTYFRTSRKFVTRLDSVYRDCIIGLSITELKQLFGKPTGTGVDRTQNKYSAFLRYTLNVTCSEQSDPSCPQILFQIIGDTIVADFRIIYSGLSDVYFTSTKKCLKKLKESAKNNWIYHSEVKRFESKNDFLSLLEGSRSWLINEVTDKEIEEILGIPPEIENGGSKFYCYKQYPCDNEKKMIDETGKGCWTYIFAFSIVTHKLYGFNESYPVKSYQSH